MRTVPGVYETEIDLSYRIPKMYSILLTRSSKTLNNSYYSPEVLKKAVTEMKIDNKESPTIVTLPKAEPGKSVTIQNNNNSPVIIHGNGEVLNDGLIMASSALSAITKVLEQAPPEDLKEVIARIEELKTLAEKELLAKS